MKLSLRARLVALRKLFSDKRHWTKHTMEERVNGRTCYCLGGGLNKVAGRELHIDPPENEIRALGFTDWNSMFCWNDAKERTVVHVRKRIDEALAQISKKNKVFSV